MGHAFFCFSQGGFQYLFGSFLWLGDFYLFSMGINVFV